MHLSSPAVQGRLNGRFCDDRHYGSFGHCNYHDHCNGHCHRHDCGHDYNHLLIGQTF